MVRHTTSRYIRVKPHLLQCLGGGRTVIPIVQRRHDRRRCTVDDEADGRDSQPEGLGEDSAQVEVAEEEWSEREDHDGEETRGPPDPALQCHAGLPKSPSGRTARTSTRVT